MQELAAHLISRGHAGLTSRLSSETALLVGIKLMTVDAKPSRDGIARMICDSKCDRLCMPCTFKANTICLAYGQGTGCHHAGSEHEPNRNADV